MAAGKIFEFFILLYWLVSEQEVIDGSGEEQDRGQVNGRGGGDSSDGAPWDGQLGISQITWSVWPGHDSWNRPNKCVNLDSCTYGNKG